MNPRLLPPTRFYSWWVFLHATVTLFPAAAADRPELDQALAAVDSIKTTDANRSKLTAQLKLLYQKSQGTAIWPEPMAKALTGSEGAGELRSILVEHGLLPQETAWLDSFPGNLSDDSRASILMLHARISLHQVPEKIAEQWPAWKDEEDRKNENQRLAEVTNSALQSNGNLNELVAALAPRNSIYHILQVQYASMHQNQEKLRAEFVKIPPIKDGDILKPGDRYPGAPVLAMRLFEEHYLIQLPAVLEPIYTQELADAVRLFQIRHDRKVDGILGPDTLSELNRGPDEEREILRLNLHRAQMLPDHPGDRYVIVNIPSARLVAFDRSEKPVVDMKTIVGEDVRERRTPIFRDNMETVEFGPYWNVPPSIVEKEIIPKARKDEYFLEHEHYLITTSYTSDRSLPVDSETLSAAESGRLFLRQMPGPGNALGQVKSLFPNDFNVYLHDTPKGELFEEAKRDFSHGCIRIEKPEQLADFVLGPQGWTPERTQEAMNANLNEPVKIESPVPVYIVYLTAFPTWDERDERTVRFHPDIYGLDQGIIQEIPNP